MIKRQVIVVKTYCFKLYKAKRNKKLHKVTYDHTLVNLLVSAGELTEEEKTEANMPEITETTTVYLENNIDMGARQEDGILTTIVETQWTPIDDFEGIFEGNNHSISGIYVYDDGSSVGIFYVATVQNLK